MVDGLTSKLSPYGLQVREKLILRDPDLGPTWAEPRKFERFRPRSKSTCNCTWASLSNFFVLSRSQGVTAEFMSATSKIGEDIVVRLPSQSLSELELHGCITFLESFVGSDLPTSKASGSQFWWAQPTQQNHTSPTSSRIGSPVSTRYSGRPARSGNATRRPSMPRWW